MKIKGKEITIDFAMKICAYIFWFSLMAIFYSQMWKWVWPTVVGFNYSEWIVFDWSSFVAILVVAHGFFGILVFGVPYLIKKKITIKQRKDGTYSLKLNAYGNADEMDDV